MKQNTGRPSLTKGEESTVASTRLTSAQYDRTCAKASRDRVSVAEVMRRALTKLLDDDADD